MTRRVRLTFSSDREGLALPRSCLTLLPELNLISDVCSFIRERFFEHVPDVALRLELGGFAINADESAKIIRDEDLLTAVTLAAVRIDPQTNPGKDEESSLKRIERHRARREKQRESRKLSRKTKSKSMQSKTNPRRSSGGVVIVTDASNQDTPAIVDSLKHKMITDSIKLPEKQTIEKSTASSKTQKPQSFSRISSSTGSVKPLPRGHFRFEAKNGAVDAVPAESEAPLSTARDGKSVERAKRLGSFFFKSPPESVLSADMGQQASAETAAVNAEVLPNISATADTSRTQKAYEYLGRSQVREAEMSVCEPEMSNVGPKTPSRSISLRDREAEMTDFVPKLPLQCSGRRDQVGDESQLEGRESGRDSDANDHYDEDADHVAILETISTRGDNFFAPRTLDRFGLKHQESQSEDTEFQARCEALTSVKDIRMLRTGAEIALRLLEIINWAPQLSKFKKYRVLETDTSIQEVTLVTSEDYEEVVKFQDMHDIKLLDEGEAVTSNGKAEDSIDSELAAALQAKRESILAKFR